ncbi:MAG TPA: hypothetical protein VHT24_10455 [Pseudacidobacterium sp.]|jgi:hypothetical protein|nr:hypothetical protein [Pseudacidobacterium sp.]
MRIFAAAVLALAIFVCRPLLSQNIPSFSGTNLANETVHLPITTSGARTVLVLGFSKKSGDACKPWFNAIASQLQAKPQVAYYEMPVIASAPSFVRGMILHNMRGSISAEQQKHFVPVTENAQVWKNAVNFSAPDDPYILIVDDHGNIIWRDSGTWSPVKEQELQTSLAKL